MPPCVSPIAARANCNRGVHGCVGVHVLHLADPTRCSPDDCANRRCATPRVSRSTARVVCACGQSTAHPRHIHDPTRTRVAVRTPPLKLVACTPVAQARRATASARQRLRSRKLATTARAPLWRGRVHHHRAELACRHAHGVDKQRHAKRISSDAMHGWAPVVAVTSSGKLATRASREPATSACASHRVLAVAELAVLMRVVSNIVAMQSASRWMLCMLGRVPVQSRARAKTASREPAMRASVAHLVLAVAELACRHAHGVGHHSNAKRISSDAMHVACVHARRCVFTVGLTRLRSVC